MPDTIADWAILTGVALWDLGLWLVIRWHARPSWLRKPNVPKAIGGRVTYDRDVDGTIQP